jgi:putative ABC transport system permease protein
MACRASHSASRIASRAGLAHLDPLPALVILFVLSGLAGLIAAAWPARRAARVDILEALATQ